MHLDAQNNEFISDAVEALDGGANASASTRAELPRRNKIGKARGRPSTTFPSPSQTPLPQASRCPSPNCKAPEATQIQEAIGESSTNQPLPPEPHSRKGRKANMTSETSAATPCDNLPPASVTLTTSVEAQATSDIPEANDDPTTIPEAPLEPELTGHIKDGTHEPVAGQPHSDQSQEINAGHCQCALIGNLIEQHRYRWQMIRARQRLELQGQAFCRSFVDGDKVAAAKLWADCRKDKEHEFRIWLAPFMAAMEPLIASQLETEKKLAKMVRTLPVYEWAKSVSGFGDVSLSAVIGELGCAPTDYKSVSAIWKRMGLAVINGGRQRRVTGDAAIEHGYNSERRAIMWNIGACLLKAQVRNEKDEDGKKIEGAAYAIGDFGQLYLDHKASLVARNEAGEFAEAAEAAVKAAKSKGSKPNAHNLEGKLAPAHIHNRAQRYIEKRLLRELWRAWRQAIARTATSLYSPASEISGA